MKANCKGYDRFDAAFIFAFGSVKLIHLIWMRGVVVGDVVAHM